MKKTINTILLMLGLFLVACSPEYDFSSNEAFIQSVYVQAEKEGLSKTTVDLEFVKLMTKLSKDPTYMKGIEELVKKAENQKSQLAQLQLIEDLKEYSIKGIQNEFKGKTVKEVFDIK